MRHQAVRVRAAFLLAALALADSLVASADAQQQAAHWLRTFPASTLRSESRPDILETPILPGSLMKVVTLVAALESQVIEPDSARMCRRVVTVGGSRYACAHPDLKRPMTPAEALAHSCNDFFVSLAPRLSRVAFNQMRAKVGLLPVPGDIDLAASFVGLAGPRVTPRSMLEAVARLVGVPSESPVALSAHARRVLRDGMRGAVAYGSASALQERGSEVLAKTGTAPMPGGSWMGLVIALEPTAHPARGITVVAPGAAGADAAAIAAGIWRQSAPAAPARAPASPAAAVAPPAPELRAPDHRAPSSAPAELRSGKPSTEHPSTKRPALPVPAQVARSIRVGINSRSTTLDLEEYVSRVLAGEGQPKAADGAQQALAIAARTFALANLNRHRREGFDLCDTTHCQVMRAPTETTRRAARDTAGLVLAHQGQPASVFYSASCGGHSELASKVWPGASDHASTSHEDTACEGEPQWSSEIRVDQIERALRAAGHRGDRLRDLRIIDRTESGRVARLRVDGFSPVEISGHELRMAVGRVVGWQQMKSTAFDVRRIGAGYRFAGRGFGHGVGMCVIGAGKRASSGASAGEILDFYFPKLSVEAYRERRLTTALPPTRSAPGAALDNNRRDDVLVVLPVAEEGQRARLLQLVRSARDEVAKQAGVSPPAVLRLTIHPTVESFGRATGQPWWVAGATDGATIDLLPMSILRQRGQVERTVRHEVAHALLDARLEGRALWVREGVALYFSDPAAKSPSPPSTTCPADAEFLRPVSAGTHRAAYARAEACVRRALARGVRWTEIK